ncbi:MAG: polyphosphate polymerase domain-containing protein [Caldilineaceae bacterium]|nr:polyphosphate polymerase domain-containing protein [Caldilineaceae bacterium]
MFPTNLSSAPAFMPRALPITTATASQPQLTPSHRHALSGPLATFPPITLAQMNSVALLNRVETKYLMPLPTLRMVLAELASSYRVLEVAQQRISRYHTLYFDTPDFALYHRHHAGALNRYKVRSREYLDSKGTFLEIKHKNNKERTLKSRLQTSHLVTTMDDEAAHFLQAQCPYDVQALQPRLWNNYRRITLVNYAQTERVTLDLDLNFAWQERDATLAGLVIAEVKQAGRTATSDFIQLMRTHHVPQSGFSKYCIGATLLYPTLKQNRFKPTKRLVEKIRQGV